MQHRSAFHRTLAKSLAGGVSACAGLLSVATLGLAPFARADVVAYLVNVHVRPGYNFPNADAALGYGYGICDKVSAGRAYAQVMGEVKADFATSDEFQASYLINQAVNELCPAQIWQLRNSAAHYRPPPALG
jgi:calcineurin-like phosphoesterase